jgi:hypothetical protein
MTDEDIAKCFHLEPLREVTTKAANGTVAAK